MAFATEKSVKFTRLWAMPNSRTYSIDGMAEIIHRYLRPELLSIDPFANNSRLATITNDLDPDCDTTYHMDAFDFFGMFDSNSVDVVLFDPPYAPRQVSECYKKFGKTVNMETTQSSFWGKLKKEIARVTKPNGYVLSFGYNTNGIGQELGFELIEIKLFAHGGAHNDTIVTVERKIQTKLF